LQHERTVQPSPSTGKAHSPFERLSQGLGATAMPSSKSLGPED